MRSWIPVSLGLVAGVALAACPPPPRSASPPPPPQDGERAERTSSGRADGEPCTAAAGCASGICEGQGCDRPGTCVARDRPCTQDMQPYCGCDGETFHASGTCPGRIYAHRGECAQGRAVGSVCSVGEQCASGICEGEGCGEEMGICAPRERACTRDLASYCSCDGETFQSSGSCPGRRFAHRGACVEEAREVGEPCVDAGDCASGICEGEGCGDESGVCVSRDRPCTMDLRPYCGCDGLTFEASGSCPGRRYRHRGACR